ncbi:putative ER lumen protein-retaining receptor C28H8.4 [Cynara cardunculus var. scolymus]|uniref:putative ER lumen protein-retaining receptor C28H8.4 n=1 Tax=Cynara cardunculus var. scolymus TaxID=59895 RepID=UPI000D630CE9|nr:putative ER lumen protein-retaining receptor C28H8.4 [Cynara cardunculus var. scolymus]
MGRKRSSAVNTLFTWVRSQSTQAKIFMAVAAMISCLFLVKRFVANHNNLFVASESVHAAGIIVLIYKLTTLKSCTGLSLQTQELTAIVLAVRIGCYFAIGHSIHTVLDVAALVSTILVIYMMRFKVNATYHQHLDKTPKRYLIIPCAVMAFSIHPNSAIPLVAKVGWAFGVYLEAIAVLPQLHMMQRTQMIEPFTAHYVFALGVSRFFRAAYWILRVYESTEAYLFLLGRGYFWVPMVLLSEAVQSFILADFCYYYLKSIVSGHRLVKLPRV